jgi:hypothetical protein
MIIKMIFFLISFCLTKTKQKFKSIRQPQFFSRSKSLRIAAEKIAVRTELAKQPHYYQRMQ